MKYLVMILRAHVPTWGAHINKDTKNFIRYFLPKGVPLTRASQKYDPAYTDKVRLVVEHINAVFKERGQFTVAQLSNHLEFDCNRCVRMFGRRGFLQAIFSEGKERRIIGWQRTGTWPPPQSFFETRLFWPGRCRSAPLAVLEVVGMASSLN